MHADSRTSSRIRKLIGAFLIASLLGACGGGGGGSGNGAGNGGGGTTNPPDLPYTGVTTAAVLGTGNAPLLAGAVSFELGFAPAPRPMPSAAAGKLHRSSGLASLAKAARAKSRTTAAMQAVTVEQCAGGGTLQTDDRINSSGTGSVIFTYIACVEDGIRTDGTVTLQIDAYDIHFELPSDFTTTFEGYTLNEGGGFIVNVDGNFHVLSSLGAGVTTTTFNVVTRYRPENVQHRLMNMVVVETLVPTGLAVTAQGRFFHSAHGYVDVDTLQAVNQAEANALPVAGTLRLRGSGPAVAQLAYVTSVAVALSLDQNGDGSADRTLRTDNELGLWGSSNYAPAADAGPDTTIPEGGTITLDGSRSSDWEGTPLRYEWYIQSGPTGSGTTIGTAPSIVYEPAEGGTYVIGLRTYDNFTFGWDTMTLTVIDNLAPVARAGADVATVERGSVTLDGSASTDAENDPITYSWTLRSGPPNNTAPQTSAGSSLNLTLDHAGTYVYALRVADAVGYSEDTVSVIVEPLIRLNNNVLFLVENRTTLQDTTQVLPLVVSSHYTGPPVTFTATSNVPWMRVVSTTGSTGANASVTVAIEPSALDSLGNATYQGALTLSPAGGYTASSRAAFMFLALPRVDHIWPYVAYAGVPSPVTLYGDNLHQTLNGTLIIDGTDVTGFDNVSIPQTQITLPALPAGEYSIRIRNNLGLVRPMGRVVVRPAPTYADDDVVIDGRVESLEYDVERDAFYIVTWDLDYGHANQIHRLRKAGATWQKDPIPAAAPQAVSLNAEGTRLLVTTANCGVLEFDPDTLALLQTATKPSCFDEVFGMVYGLPNGTTIVGDTNQWPTVWSYPSFVQMGFPSVHNPVHLLNYDRTRMIWAESPSISPPNELYLVYSSNGNSEPVAVHDPDMYFLPGLIAINGDGRRFMHRADVYADTQYIGSLQGISHPYLSPALTRPGDRAVVLEPDSNTLSLFDLTGSAPFARITDVAVLGNVGYANRIALLPDDRVAFVFTSTSAAGVTTFRLYTRNLP